MVLGVGSRTDAAIIPKGGAQALYHGAMSFALAVETRVRQALASGALEPIETIQESICDAGVRFAVRRVSSLALKHGDAGATRGNPFLPYDERLFVADVTDTHVALLNKYPVIERHVLLVTRRFADQEAPLDAGDCEALALCLEEGGALGFYNAGREAGASQSHRHLQVAWLDPVPVEALFRELGEVKSACEIPRLPFRHAFRRRAGAADLFEGYRELLDAAGVRPPAPYNLLATRDWMLLVPRSREAFEGISINALGFAGSLFVRDAAQLERVRRAGPMNVLRAVAMPRGSSPRGAG
jgi:ATP adenylyltransferase